MKKIYEMKFYITIFLFFLFHLQVFSQEPEYLKVMETEEKLQKAFDELYSDPTLNQDSINQMIMQTFESVLATWDGFYYKWKKLDKIGIVWSEDKRLKIITWYIQKNPDEYKYYGFIQYKPAKNKRNREILLYQLDDHSGEMRDPAVAEVSANRWFGCLYYDVRQFGKPKDTYYTLLGYDFNDRLSTIKLIEILTFNKQGEPLFGGEIHSDKKVYARLLNEYSSDLVISQKYLPRLDMIIFDHLEPFQPIFEGNYRFYGPVGSYDGLRFDDGKFFLEEDVDARNY